MISKLKKAVLALVFMGLLSVPARAEDCWLSVSGAGSKNGTSAMNAYGAVESQGRNAQVCWNQTSAEGTMHVMEGDYTVENRAFWRLEISGRDDGTRSKIPASFKTLSGEGRVFLQGPRPVPYHPDRQAEGGPWITFGRGASRIAVKNFHVARVAEGLLLKEGANIQIRFEDLHFEDTRQNFYILGHPFCTSEKSCRLRESDLSHDIVIRKTSGLRYSKRHVRLGGGVFQVEVADSQADAGFLDGDFAVGFDVENPAHDIAFHRCVSRNNIYTKDSYWNGDGFKSEAETRNILWKDCSAFDNADAGFDIKTRGAVLENIVALRNNRNIRTWSPETAILKNANASFSMHRGGEGTEAGLWNQGAVECHFCTLHNNKVQVLTETNGKGSKITLVDSILSMNAQTRAEGILEEEGSRVDLVRTDLWQEGVSGLDPQFGKGANAQWEGGNREFDSLVYGKMKGYHYE